MSSEPSPAPEDATTVGLSDAEAAARLRQFGPNALPEPATHPLRAFLSKLWAPVPWMLEATVVLELLLGKHPEAIVIAALLLMNALLSLLQERKAGNALALLRKRLPVKARVLRNSTWQTLDAQQVVPGDVVHLRMGDLVPADIRISDGQISLDQSSLTGESLPVDAGAGTTAYAGAMVKRGEASGEVTATGARTYFGKTADLVNTAKTVSHLQTIIFRIVQYLIILDAVLVAALLLFAGLTRLPLQDMLPFALILLVASVPVALPATFTLATALGSMELAKEGVLVTRLTAIEEAAAMDLLLSDKTGTITENRLAVAETLAYAPCTRANLLRLASFASDPASQDPIDLAVLRAANEQEVDLATEKRSAFIPFDTSTKVSEATLTDGGSPLRVVKGFPSSVAARVAGQLPPWTADVERLSASGYRVIAVASGPPDALRLAGLIAMEDPPRADSKSLIESLRSLGVRVLMVTGDGVATATAVAAEVGIGQRNLEELESDGNGSDRKGADAKGAEAKGAEIKGAEIRTAPPRVWGAQNLNHSSGADLLDHDVFAGVYPADKVKLVLAAQASGHVSGMTGDGVNDAPALKQAEVGIAVANATDVAKAAASIVLTNPGLADILAAVKTSRRIYQRMLTYTLNKIIKTIEIALFLSFGVMLTRTFVITPLLIVLLLFTNDFVTMSIATDNVSFSAHPDRWNIRSLVLTAGSLASVLLVFSFGVFFTGRNILHLPLGQLQTLAFVMLVFSGQGTVYLVRERNRLWSSRPSVFLVASSIADIAIVSLMAANGILMTSIPWTVIASLFGAMLVFLLMMDSVKVRIFRSFAIQ